MITQKDINMAAKECNWTHEMGSFQLKFFSRAFEGFDPMSLEIFYVRKKTKTETVGFVFKKKVERQYECLIKIGKFDPKTNKIVALPEFKRLQPLLDNDISLEVKTLAKNFSNHEKRRKEEIMKERLKLAEEIYKELKIS